MTEPTTNHDGLEERVPLRPRAARGAVLSVRLTSDEAQRVAGRAEKSGLSVSEYARRTIRQSLGSSWRLAVWDGLATFVFAPAPETGGDYGRVVCAAENSA